MSKKHKKRRFNEFLRSALGLPGITEGKEIEVNDWDVADEIDEVKECGMVGNPFVYIAPLAQNKISLLMDKFPDKEWLGYLIGDVQDNVFLIRNIVVPEQEVTGASVEVLKFPVGTKDIIGVMHSHNTMSAYFSGVDNDYINSNHSLSLVISDKGMKGTARFKTPCGVFIRRDNVKIFAYLPKSNLVEFEEQVDTNVKVKSYGIEYVDHTKKGGLVVTPPSYD